MGKDLTPNERIAAALSETRKRNEVADKRPSRSKKARQQYHQQKDHMEVRLVELVDNVKALRKFVPKLDEYLAGKIPADVAFASLGPAALQTLARIMAYGESEKNQMDAAKHLLGLAGYTPSQKHEISRVDANTPKEALVSLILGNKKTLEASGIEIVEDDESES